MVPTNTQVSAPEMVSLRDRPETPAVSQAQAAAFVLGKVSLEMAVLSVEGIGVDQGYQRPPNEERITRIARGFDMSLCGAIDVSRRPDGTHWVIDGQHRLLAARLAGEKDILANIWVFGSVAEEARFFRAKAENRVGLSSLDKMKAAFTEGDPNTRAIVACVNRCGFHMGAANKTKATDPTAISAANALLKLTKWPTTINNDPRHGTPNIPRLEAVLRLVAATWPNTPGATIDHILRGIDLLIRTYGPDLDQTRFIERLGKEDPMTLARKAGSEARIASMDSPTLVAVILAKLYNYKAVKYRLDLGRLIAREDESSTKGVEA